VTTISTRVDLDRISTEARQVKFTVTVLTLIAAVFFAIGWVTARVWLGVVWSALMIREGWREAQKAQKTGVARGAPRTG
jgi:hypothetical protein